MSLLIPAELRFECVGREDGVDSPNLSSLLIHLRLAAHQAHKTVLDLAVQAFNTRIGTHPAL